MRYLKNAAPRLIFPCMLRPAPCALFLAACLLCPANCFARSFSRAYFTMGTMLEITVFHNDENKANKAMHAAYEEVRKVDECASVYDEKSETALFNGKPAGSFFSASPLFFSLVEQSLYYSRITNGAFDVTVFPLVKLWGFYDGESLKTFPQKSKIASALRPVDYRALKLQKEKEIVSKYKASRLDFGGIAKGFALDKASKALKTHGIKNARMDFFSTTFYLGNPEGAGTFVAALAHPEHKNKNLLYIHVSDDAVSVSANTENFFVHNGRKYSHIVNPKTGYPVFSSLSSVMVFCGTAACADALSTALFVMDIRKGKMFLKKHPEIHALFVSEKKHKLLITASRALKQRILLEEGEENHAVISFF